jgi:hypothetical protein
VRTNAFSYSIGNLDGLMKLAWLGSQVGVDLWNFRTSDGRSIRVALDFLLPYATGVKKWDYEQIGGFHGDALLSQLERAAVKYHDPKYIAAVHQLGAGKDDLQTVLLQRASILRLGFSAVLPWPNLQKSNLTNQFAT